MKKPLVSIIILNYNGIVDTIKCIKSFTKTKYSNYEVFLVDNGSDNSEGITLKRKYGKKYNVLLLKNNLGFTGGNNFALKKANGKYVILLNNDTEVTPNWIEPMVSVLEKDKTIAVVQPKIKMLQKKNYFDYAGAAGGYLDKYGYPFTRGRIFETKEKDIGQYDNPYFYPIFWASGACCIIRKSIIGKVGGLFDSIFFNYMEEIDFCWRVWNSGYRIYFCPSSIVYHLGAATAGKNLTLKRYWEHRNNLILLYKNLNHNYFKIWIIRILLEAATYIHYLQTGNILYIKSLLHAHKDFIILLLEERFKKNKYKTGESSNIPFFPSSIVYYYHILKRYTFNKLEWSAKGNVSFLILNTKASGGIKLILSQVNRLISKGYFVNIYTIFGKNIGWFQPKAKIKNLSSYYHNLLPDKLIFTFWPTSYLSLFLKSNEKYYLVMDSVLFYHNIIIKNLIECSFKFHSKIITISSFLKHEILKINPNADVQLINTNTVNYQEYLYKRRKNNVRKGIIRILSVVSNYEYYKGIDLLVKTIQHLKNTSTRYHITLVSREKYKYNPIFDRFFSNPSNREVIRCYQESDVLLATSRAEGLFLPGLEAMATGCLVVSTNSYGLLDYAKNNYNCILVKKYSDIWEKDVINSTFKNTSLSNKLIANGYSSVEKYTNNAAKIDSIEEVLFGC